MRRQGTAAERILWAPNGPFPGLSESLQTRVLAGVWRCQAVQIPSAQLLHPRGTAMVQAVRPVDSTVRLVEQLNALSQLVESLAFRVVELEERLAASELKIQPLLKASIPAGHTDDTELRLDDTEERIARLEALLTGVGSVSQARSWGAQPARQQQPLDPEPESLEDPDPFIDEGEQSFMDELAA